ncbi:MAG: calcium-binding protein [Gammaproteobacteria bacterium]|nr:calcium-binding protein [Gammaproteobacteria bacterium]
MGSGGRDDSSPSPGTSSPSGGGFASQGGNTSPVGGPNSNPGNRGSSSGNTRSGSSGGDGDGGGNSGGDGGGFKPIVLDLDGDGVELVALDESAAFYDINADGYQYNLGWAGADDGLLAYDKNSDGVINRKDEISFVDYVPGAQTDLEGLRNFDSNADSVLDASDAEFAKFRVWQDANQNGASDSGELRALVAAGIRSIELNYVPSDDGQPETRDGNIISGQGRYHKTNGASGTFADVAFAASAFGFRTDGDNLEFKSADGVGKVYVAPANAGGVNMNFASSVNAAHIGAIGGSHADVLNGGGVSRDLLLFGDEGNDRLTGGSGDDWLAGGAGADTLRGGNGNDVLFFDARDNINGGSGQDVGVVSGSGAINLSMGAVGLEALHSGDGNDRLSGADSAQGVIIDGGGGADTMRGSHHRDVLSGGAGNDHIKGKPGDDVILGGAGDDDLFGNFGDDVLFGGEGDDYLNGLVGDDALYGGAGSDTYDFGYPNVPMGVLPDFGRETVRDSGGANDKVTFGRRRHEDLWLAKDGDDLRISILGGDDEVLIEDQFAAGGEHRIEHLSAATRIYRYGRYNAQTVSIDALVNAMAQFDKPQAGWSHMTTQQRADVHAAWRSVGIAPTVG